MSQSGPEEGREQVVRTILLLSLSLLVAGCGIGGPERAEPPATPISMQIQRIDDPNQGAITYSSKEIYQRGPEFSPGGAFVGSKVPADRIAWTLLGLQNRETGQRRYRLTLAMTYDSEEADGFRDYNKAKVVPNGPDLSVQPYSKKRSTCTDLSNRFCQSNEVVFVWLPEETLVASGAAGLTLQIGGETGRIWEFTVPQELIAALFDKMNQSAAR